MPGLTYIRVQEVGLEVTKNGYPVCEGKKIQKQGRAYEGVVQHSRYRMVITHEKFPMDLETKAVVAMHNGEILRCLSNERGCQGVVRTYALGAMSDQCQFERIKRFEARMENRVAISADILMALNISDAQPLVTQSACQNVKLHATQYAELWVAMSGEDIQLAEQLDSVTSEVDPMLQVQVELDFI